MTNPDGYPREFHIKLDNGTGTITFRENDSNQVLDYEHQRDENFASRLIVAVDNATPIAANNLLNSSCALWSAGTAALQMGDLIRFGLYQSDGSTVDVKFDGVITEISHAGDGVIIIEAYDYLKRAEYTKPTYTHGANYLDESIKAITNTGSVRYIGGVTESDIVSPLVKVGFAHTDYKIVLTGDADQANDISTATHYVDQAFIAHTDHFLGCRFRWSTDWGIGGSINLTLTLYRDDDNTKGAVIDTETVALTQVADSSPTDVEFSDSNTPVRLIKGQKYWMEIKCTSVVLAGGTHFSITSKDDSVDALEYGLQGATEDSWVTEFYHESGGGRTSVPGEILDIRFHFTDYEELDQKDYWFDDANDRIYLWNQENGINIVEGEYYTINRGLVSYYYGTITKEALCDRLIQANTGMNAETDTNLDKTFGVFSTRGKSILECLQEVCDVYEDSGSWSGYQSVMASYLDGSGYPTLQVNKRKKTSDAATYIISHGKDTANDDEHIIIEGGCQLKKTTKQKYAKVTVVGKSLDGEPLVCTRTDEALSASFFGQMLGMAEWLVVTDESLNSLDEVNRAAYALLDAVVRDSWEGTIRLSGQHEDMFTLNYSPLGISATKFKVKSMVLRPVETEIYITNTDSVLENRLTEGWGRARRSESFLSPVGQPEVIYGCSYYDGIITTATLYAELCDSSGTALTNQERVLCTRYLNVNYNATTYHAEWIAGNGYSSTIGGVGQIKLYTTKTGGAASFTIDLTRTVNNITVDEEVDKFKSTKLIFEILADAS